MIAFTLLKGFVTQSDDALIQFYDVPMTKPTPKPPAHEVNKNKIEPIQMQRFNTV